MKSKIMFVSTKKNNNFLDELRQHYKVYTYSSTKALKHLNEIKPDIAIIETVSKELHELNISPILKSLTNHNLKVIALFSQRNGKHFDKDMLIKTVNSKIDEYIIEDENENIEDINRIDKNLKIYELLKKIDITSHVFSINNLIKNKPFIEINNLEKKLLSTMQEHFDKNSDNVRIKKPESIFIEKLKYKELLNYKIVYKDTMNLLKKAYQINSNDVMYIYTSINKYFNIIYEKVDLKDGVIEGLHAIIRKNLTLARRKLHISNFFEIPIIELKNIKKSIEKDYKGKKLNDYAIMLIMTSRLLQKLDENYAIRDYMKKKFIVAHSPDSDDIFMYYAIKYGWVETSNIELTNIALDIDTLNIEALKGTHDITAISFALYPLIKSEYALLKTAISFGDGYGPKLIKLKDTNLKKGFTVAISGEHTTNAMIFKLRYPEAKIIYKNFLDIEKAVLDGSVDAGVLIHESILNFNKKLTVECEIFDIWKDYAPNLPLPLGGMVIRRSIPINQAINCESILTEGVKSALKNRDELSDKLLKNGIIDRVNRKELDKYLDLYANEESVELSEKQIEALDRLYEIGYEKGFYKEKIDTKSCMIPDKYEAYRWNNNL